MRQKLNNIFLATLPALVFGLFVVVSHTFGPVSWWVDWGFLVLSAALVVLNPIFKYIKPYWVRILTIIGGFVVWGFVLFYLAFLILALFFSEGL